VENGKENMAAKQLTDEEVVAHAQRWVQCWRIVKYRDKMDGVLDGLSQADQRRVILCGQRMVGGLPLKVIPAASKGKEEEDNGKKPSKGKREQQIAANGGAEKAQGKVSVGASGNAKKGSQPRTRAGQKK
jgi:hypothetical protein